MSGLASAALCKAIRERLDGTLSGVRAMTAGRLERGEFESLGDAERARRALEMPRLDVELVDIQRSPAATLSEIGDVQILRVGVRIRTVYQLPTEYQADDHLAQLNVQRGMAADDSELIRQSLMWPTGLVRTSDSLATLLISGVMRQREPSRRTREDVKSGLLEWEHAYEGDARVTPDANSLGSFGGAEMFVFEPGGTSHDNVYATFPEVEAAMALVYGHKVLQCSQKYQAVVIPAKAASGSWAIKDWTLFGSYGEPILIQIADGCKFTNTSTPSLFEAISVENLGSTPGQYVFTFDPATPYGIPVVFWRRAEMFCSGLGGGFSAGAGLFPNVYGLDQSLPGDSNPAMGPMWNVTATGGMYFYLFGASFTTADVIQGPVGSTLGFQSEDGGSFVDFPQPRFAGVIDDVSMLDDGSNPLYFAGTFTRSSGTGTVTRFVPHGDDPSKACTVAEHYFAQGRSRRYYRFFVRVEANPFSTNTTLTLRIDGIDLTLSVVIPPGGGTYRVVSDFTLQDRKFVHQATHEPSLKAVNIDGGTGDLIFAVTLV